MPNSQNGYSVIERTACKWYTVGEVDLPLRPDAAGYVLYRFLQKFHNRVEPLRDGQTFGHSKRQISGSTEWSNHASGTASDANSVKHPYGKANTFTSEQLSDIRELLRDFDGVIRWGGDYRYTKDEMHFEIDKPYAEVKTLSAVLRKNNTVAVAKLKPGNRNIYIYMVKRALRKRGLFDGVMNNYFGVGLRNAYKEWQESLGYTGSDADGVPGAASLRALGFKTK